MVAPVNWIAAAVVAVATAGFMLAARAGDDDVPEPGEPPGDAEPGEVVEPVPCFPGRETGWPGAPEEGSL